MPLAETTPALESVRWSTARRIAGLPKMQSLRRRSRTLESFLSDLSARFANFQPWQAEGQIARALSEMNSILSVDRSFFAQFSDEGWLNVLCSAAVEGTEPLACRPLPPFLAWYVRTARMGKLCVLRSHKDLPPEAREAEYFCRSGLRSQLAIPLAIGGKIVGVIDFASFTVPRDWPAELILRLKLAGEVFAFALERKRLEKELGAALVEIERLKRENLTLPTEDVARSRFGLTMSEARVALGIAKGHALGSIAIAHGVTVATARTQLKSVFSKLGAHRQAELRSLLLGMSIVGDVV